jgi:hypothetical protein
MKILLKKLITESYLKENPNHIFVFGDNTQRVGKGGAAKLRHLPNTYGFITKKFPNNLQESFYRPLEYYTVYLDEIIKLKRLIENSPDKYFLISPIGEGLANRHRIFETIINPSIRYHLKDYPNVEYLWEEMPTKDLRVTAFEQIINDANSHIREIVEHCNHPIDHGGTEEYVGSCPKCGEYFDGWKCSESPDGVCHYYSDEGKVELIDGSYYSLPENYDADNETDDGCIFCGQPRERK